MRLPYGDNASQSKTYGTFHDLLNDTLMVFGVADYQRSKCLQVAQTFSSVWDELHRDTQEALIKDLREKLVKAEEAKAKWRQENPDRKWTWDWRIAIEYLVSGEYSALRDDWTLSADELEFSNSLTLIASSS